MTDSETGQRGYLLTGRDSYLAPYKSALEELPKNLEHLGNLVADSPQESHALIQLRQLTNQKLDELRETVDERSAGHNDAALTIVNSDRGLQVMQDIRQLIG